ncbi:TIR domain-containing protein [Azohydromonas caseinilytica]|uniref:TIR domain-containing protein n=1 Tax=Azohydromonas caseinilytica TaxID=2728836 RepID=A0A848FC75_9BURK|nr:TIR domain-containing protein [Azohydromonas caseinilytica]NML16922.1 TIR domain-containing protein [Azohydromonas caseinilytica]
MTGFVICYHPQDKDWAEYIDQCLRSLKYDTFLDLIDLKAGDNAIQELHSAIQRLQGAVLIVSEYFLRESRDEIWTAIVHSGYRVIPIIVDDSSLQGLLAPLTSIRLHGLNDAQAMEAIRQGLEPRRRRNRPPAFTDTQAPTAQATPPNAWRRLLDRLLPRFHFWLCLHGFLQKPSEYSELHNYLSECRASLQQSIRRRFYIPMDARALPVPISPLATEQEAFVQPVRHLIRQITGSTKGGDGATAQLSLVSRRSHVVHNIVKTLLRSSGPLVLLGDPGSGKTMTLEHAMLAVIEQQRHRIYPSIPIFVRLGDFHVEQHAPSFDDVQQFMLSNLNTHIRAHWVTLRDSGRIIVFFDSIDEMSRDRYGQHSAALSSYASSVYPLVRTLFSCRINDFSPEFSHDRLVLLPFDRRQLQEYLRLYIPHWPLQISGESFSTKSLAARLESGNLFVDPRNPFVLWLLCIYLCNKKSWPTSRPGLLAFYCRHAYNEKRADRKNASTFARIKRPFTALSRLAFILMQRNLGTSATLSEIQKELPDIDVITLIFVGTRCGFLEQSLNQSVPRVRFAHHRLQEFFAARHLRHSSTEFDWLTVMDAPRWQETLINYIQLGGRQEPVEQLAESVNTHVSEIRARIGAPDLRWRRRPMDRYGINDAAETLLADRVDLLSRLVQHGITGMSATAVATLEQGIQLLTQYGNPSSQVKMLWAWKNVPDADVGKEIGQLLNSSIAWVRSQALTLIAESPAHRQHLGTDTPMQIATIWPGVNWRTGSAIMRKPSRHSKIGGPGATCFMA